MRRRDAAAALALAVGASRRRRQSCLARTSKEILSGCAAAAAAAARVDRRLPFPSPLSRPSTPRLGREARHSLHLRARPWCSGIPVCLCFRCFQKGSLRVRNTRPVAPARAMIRGRCAVALPGERVPSFCPRSSTVPRRRASSIPLRGSMTHAHIAVPSRPCPSALRSDEPYYLLLGCK